MFSTFAMGIPIDLSISNNEAFLGLTATPLRMEIGYPRSSVLLGNNTYIEITTDESTPLVSLKTSVNSINFKILSLSFGETSKFGQLEGRLDNGKILEIGRNFITANTELSFSRAVLKMEYSRFYSSFNYNSSKKMIFLAPPNYNGEEPNVLSMYASYSLNSYKDFKFTLFTHMKLHFSDAFVFENPSYAVGISISTTTENLQNTFQMPH